MQTIWTAASNQGRLETRGRTDWMAVPAARCQHRRLAGWPSTSRCSATASSLVLRSLPFGLGRGRGGGKRCLSTCSANEGSCEEKSGLISGSNLVAPARPLHMHWRGPCLLNMLCGIRRS